MMIKRILLLAMVGLTSIASMNAQDRLLRSEQVTLEELTACIDTSRVDPATKLF